MQKKKLFDDIPCLEGEHLILRKMTDSDCDALREMSDNGNIY